MTTWNPSSVRSTSSLGNPLAPVTVPTTANSSAARASAAFSPSVTMTMAPGFRARRVSER